MRSDLRSVCAGLLATLALQGTGCGLFGHKADLNSLLNYNSQGVGCMNQIGANVQAYYKGTIDAATWAATWDCATNNLKLFQQFVQPSSPAGFTQGDIQAFVSKLLITNQPITSDLIGALFELKASLFGGTRDVIAPAELGAVMSFLGTLKTQTGNLLPYMAARVTQPTPANLLALADAMLAAGDAIASSLNVQGNPTFTFASEQTLANELSGILHVSMGPDLMAWLNAVEIVLTAGGTAGIAASDWPVIIRSIVSYGGPALAVFSIDSRYLTGPNAAGQFGMQLGGRIKTSLLQTLDLYGGALPLTAIDTVIDALPASWLTIDRTAIKGALRPIANRLLQSRVPNAIDSSVLDLIYDKLQYWSEGQTALETIYDKLNPGPLGVPFPQFQAAASDYAYSLPPDQSPPYYRMIALARDTRPLFIGDDDQMTFTANVNYSLHDLSLFNIFSIVAQHVVATYSSIPGGLTGAPADLQQLVTDFTPLVRAIHASDLSVPGWAQARFLEASLFTFASRGDTTSIDVDEAMYLIAMAFSSGSITNKVRAGVDAVCKSLGTDVIGFNWVDPDCFRREFFYNFRKYWDHEPLLVQAYQNLSVADQQTLQQSMERAARRYGVSQQPIASVDIQGFGGIMQYLESLMARWDTNGDQHLDLGEANQAYPVFKGPLTQLGGLQSDPDWIIKSVFTYVLNYGHAPTKDFAGIMSLVGWIAITPFWSINADRLKLYEVIASIVVPQPLPSGTPTGSAAEAGTPAQPTSYTDLANSFGISLDSGISPLLQPMPLPSGM